MRYLKRFNESKVSKTFGANLFIKRLENIKESLNVTKESEEQSLERYFDLESIDIKDWFQDFLDEYTDLDFEVSVMSKKIFVVNFFDQVLIQRSEFNITKEKYPVTEEMLSFLEGKLKHYDLKFIKDGIDVVYYSTNKSYMSFTISKIGHPLPGDPI